MVKAISSNVAQYITVQTFVKALRAVVVEELQPKLLNAGKKLSGTPPFPWSGLTMKAAKTVYNLVHYGNKFELEFADFLEKAGDVAAFAKLPERFRFSIDYTDAVANLRYYEPDFVAVTTDGSHHLVETKGRAARIWCENATVLTGVEWDYVKVGQIEYNKLRPTLLADLNALI